MTLRERWTDERIERVLGEVLRLGVLLSATLVLCGGLVYLSKRTNVSPDYHVFQGEPADLRSVDGIIADARSHSGRGLIQLGLLLLIATPIARVVFSALGFSLQRDWLYVAISLTVLTLLVYSLLAA
jgi:uncharacterized membrane protein